MQNTIIFLGGFAMSLLTFGLMARCGWWARLSSLPSGRAEALLLAPHAFRHLGLLALVPEVVGEGLAKTPFAAALATGDAVVAPLALVAMWMWLAGSRGARAFTWLFSVVASLDLANAIYGALALPVTHYAIGAFWIVLTCVVPLLIVTQAMIFMRLRQG